VFRDCARYARRHGIAFRAPQFHPFRSLTALRVSLGLVAGTAQAQVVGALYRAGWGDGIDLGSSDEIAAALDRAGLDGKGLVARTSEPDVKQALKDETARAISLGVFGVPTMIVGDELFWGKDRLSDVNAFLGGDDPLSGFDLGEIAPRGSSATRPAAR
jgi:2-hydroxychromene-2-carboxylate isomerase